MTEGQPAGHCIRSCWIGIHIGRTIQLEEKILRDLYYTLLLKDLGCSSNAARICELYLSDDLQFKRNFKLINSGSIAQVLDFVFKNTASGSRLPQRLTSLINVMRNGSEITQEMTQTRCTRGADIARQLRFSEAVAEGIYNLDEHWDGGGHPGHLKKEQIPLFSRIALLSQVIDVFHFSGGKETALKEIAERSGKWFDPQLVKAFQQVADKKEFWEGLIATDLQKTLLSLEPGLQTVSLDDDFLDEIAAAFGQVVDSKSPYTAGHSERVAVYAELIGQELGLDNNYRRWLKRGALLHDLGKLGVSNTILDKPGKLDEEEWKQIRLHPGLTEQILVQMPAFRELALVAGAHHEKLDGTGYPKKMCGEEITLGTRVITTADIFDAITANRPYRGPIPVAKALDMMEAEIGVAIDAQCFAALKTSLNRLPENAPK